MDRLCEGLCAIFLSANSVLPLVSAALRDKTLELWFNTEAHFQGIVRLQHWR